MGDLSGVERHENLEEKFVIQFWSFPPLNDMLHVVCFSSLIVTVLRKYWAGNIIKEFTLKDGRVTRTSCSTSSEDVWKVRLVVLFKFTRDFHLKGSDVGYGLTN